jgi:hypothetical protein
MGLDITAYSRLTYVGHCPDRDEEHGYDPETFDRLHVEAYAYDTFPHALMGVPNLRPLAGYSGSKFTTGGCFALTEKTETHRFRAGSYGGYSRWRKELADQFNPYRTGPDGDRPPSPEGPFYELIWFADNEGTLSELAATKLLGNFRQFEVDYAASHDEYDTERYRHWLRAFELAADGGLVDFH